MATTYVSEDKKNLTVTLKSDEMRFAIMNKTHVTARSLEANGKLGYEAAAALQANEDDENMYELARAITTAIADAKIELNEFLDKETPIEESDNLIDNLVEQTDGEVVISFSLPTNFDSSAADAVGKEIHDFIIGRSIYDWYRQTAPELAAACKADGDEALAQAKRSLYRRLRPTRPTPTRPA